ncbi:kinase-like protein [Hyaloscypha variabilis F]|uniref:Kinase-like protein n=1 Tax=Hyaloscypha variabilis (strain UAMH 11265 / GT02V1 / F) TaxID=1149755 RepID=A0A2J6S7A0_HYAVF|nr:kinase-like protein [Hyaloscypha variabilis F]
MSHTAKRLARKLKDEKVEWPPTEHRFFIPDSEINHRVREDTVREVLRELHPELNDRKLDQASVRICSEAPKLFTILLLCGSDQPFCSKILDFLDNHVADEDLPLARVYPPGERHYTLAKKDHKDCLGNHDGNCEIMAFSSWSWYDIEDFCRDQWQVLAPVFTSYVDHVRHYDLEGSTILPYIRDQQYESGAVKSGGYSRVWGVEIHPAHQKLLPLSDSSGPTIAVKQLNSSEQEDFDREYEMLSKLALTKDPHLIRLLATYKFKNQYHFLFPFAKFNLKTYWKNFQLDWEKKAVFWVIRQLLGLASALHVIHEFKTAAKEERFGRHGDLKPENILWFKSFEHTGHAGILQITDLGLGRFHRLESRSKQDPKDIFGSPTYVPPELALQKLVSRSYDIWSFGCVLLEFITWMLDGNAGVDAFADARMALAHDNVVDDTFYTVYSPGPGMYATVRPEVTAWIQRLRGRRRYSPMIRDLLDLVENGMLQANSADRIRSEPLKDRLEQIVEKAEKHPSSYMLGRVE